MTRKIPTHLFDGSKHSLKTFKSAYGKLSKLHPDLLPPVGVKRTIVNRHQKRKPVTRMIWDVKTTK